MVPSGTTYGVLLEQRDQRGDSILALGDPDYGVGRAARQDALTVMRGASDLSALPGTRAEAKAVGDRVLLGRDASETGLRRAVEAGHRWRAVHLACHGLIRTDRPVLSSLALTADAENDGFVSVLDVFRLKIPADLVVLSACETARGSVYHAEGVVGFTRAFMFAGAPRVLVSLWKVDDEATRALMTKFYQLWSPPDGKQGLPTATALRRAQEHVRAQERWRHPYYWAAWQLWGLPD
jgi:CHAT domain-containing protein